MNAISNFSNFAMIEACKIAAKSSSNTNLFLPKFESGSPVHTFVMKGRDANAVYGFWYAGIIISGNNNDTVLSITMIPQNDGNLLIAKTAVENQKIRKLKIVQSMEAKGISFGGFNFSKLEVKIHYNDLRTAFFESKTTLSLHDRLGRKLKDLNENELPIQLPKTDIDLIIQPPNPSSLNSLTNTTDQEVRLFQALDTSGLEGRSIFQFPNEKIEIGSEFDILESEINGDSLIELDQEEVLKIDEGGVKSPGIYIEVANQGGISSLSILVMYSIDEEGGFHPIMFNQCSNTVNNHFRDKIRRKKKSGFFSSKIKIKRVLKVFSESTLNCGEIKTASSLLQGDNRVQKLKTVEAREESEIGVSTSSTRGGGFIDSFKKALAKIHELDQIPTSESKFPNLKLNHYSLSLELRVRQPKIINQGPFNLCGPAAFLYFLASTDPDAYATIAIDLILKGKASYGNLKFIPHPDMVNQHPGTFEDPNVEGLIHVMDAVDWLTMSALRYVENDFIWPGYNPKTNTGIGGLTTHWEMSSWLENIENVKENRVSGSLSFSEMNDAINAGKRMVFLIDAGKFINKMTKESSKNNSKGFEGKMSAVFAPIFGNHFVVLDSNIQRDSFQNYEFTIWTWGDYREITLSQSDFEDSVIATFIIEQE